MSSPVEAAGQAVVAEQSDYDKIRRIPYLYLFNVLNSNTTSGYAVNFTRSNQIQLGGGAPFVQRSAGAPRNLQLQLQYTF